MLQRLFTAVMLLSLLLAVATAVLWARAMHGHSDVIPLHIGSYVDRQFTTLPDGRVAARAARPVVGGLGGVTVIYKLREVFGGCLFVPALWVAVRVRRRLLPRRPGSELPSLRSAR